MSMNQIVQVTNPDYVIIGHITQDITPAGLTPGGTALYAGLCAHALGVKVGVLTSLHPDFSLPLPDDIQVSIKTSPKTSRFENIQGKDERAQYIYQKAADLHAQDVPSAWSTARILHLGPVCREVDPSVLDRFPNALVCLTPQGWMREWHDDGRISYRDWENAEIFLSRAQIACFSLEDVRYNENIIEKIAASIPVFVVTEAARGARVYWNGDLRHFKAPTVTEVESTGAGDIFAAAFFIRYHQTRNPWEAARFANHLAALSVTRKGLDSIPRKDEVRQHSIEIIKET